MEEYFCPGFKHACQCDGNCSRCVPRIAAAKFFRARVAAMRHKPLTKDAPVDLTGRVLHG